MLGLANQMEGFDQECKARTIAAANALSKGANKQYDNNLFMVMSALYNVVNTVFCNTATGVGKAMTAKALSSMLMLLSRSLKENADMDIQIIDGNEVDKDINELLKKSGFKITEEVKSMDDTDEETFSKDGIAKAFKKFFTRKSDKD